MLDRELESSLNQLFQKAREQHHEFVTIEHLLLALLDNDSALNVLKACGANISRLRKNTMDYLADTVSISPDSSEEQEAQPSLSFQRVLQRAVFQVQSSGRQAVNGANVIIAIFSEVDSHSVKLIRKENISRLDVVNYVTNQLANSSNINMAAPQIDSHQFEDKSEIIEPITKTYQKTESDSLLDVFTVNMNKLAEEGRMSKVVEREQELMATAQILCRRRKNNPLLVGEPGVGKTAIVEGIALRIVEGDIPESLAKATIYSLDLGSLLAGTKYRGDFEKRLKRLIFEIKQQPDAILFIDEIHSIIGAGAASGGGIDAANLIKPVLARGELRVIGATTYEEYRNIFEKDRAFSRRFQKIDVEEPSVEQTISILQALKPSLESHHHVKYSASALQAAAELSERYITNRHLPDKAIDVIDEAGAFQALQPVSKRKKTINEHEIKQIVAKMARMPSDSITRSDKRKLGTLARDLKMLIYGQDNAVDALVDAITLSRAGLNDPQKPLGNFLFAGPTGVGKTEVAKQLANLLDLELMRFDMSEYSEQHGVARLIGAPPGYVGYDQGGMLTEAVTKHPHSILLLDEIEKAHADIFNILLQIMDYGTLTDNNGAKADFRHVIIIMTSNAGADAIEKSSIGFTQQDHSGDGIDTIQRVFAPEFRNRLDALIQFAQLTEVEVARVVDKFIMELEVQLDTKKVRLIVEDEAKQWFVKNGYDKQMGARPLARIITEHLRKPLANELLFGKLTNGGKVIADVRNNELELTIKSLEKKLPVKVDEQ